MGYKTYQSYRTYAYGLEVFEKYRKDINKTPLPRRHQIAYKSTTSVSGYPDDGK